jgi:hypothetical protein
MYEMRGRPARKVQESVRPRRLQFVESKTGGIDGIYGRRTKAGQNLEVRPNG